MSHEVLVVGDQVLVVASDAKLQDIEQVLYDNVPLLQVLVLAQVVIVVRPGLVVNVKEAFLTGILVGMLGLRLLCNDVDLMAQLLHKLGEDGSVIKRLLGAESVFKELASAHLGREVDRVSLKLFVVLY